MYTFVNNKNINCAFDQKKISSTQIYVDNTDNTDSDEFDDYEGYSYNIRKRDDKNKKKSLYYNSGFRKTLHRGGKHFEKQKRAKKKITRE